MLVLAAAGEAAAQPVTAQQLVVDDVAQCVAGVHGARGYVLFLVGRLLVDRVVDGVRVGIDAELEVEVGDFQAANLDREL